MPSSQQFLALLVIVSGAVDAAAVPDRWPPFENQRVVSSNGRRYVVVRMSGRGIEFELCERRAGAAPILPAASSAFRGDGAAVARDAKDRLVAKGWVEQLPLRVEALNGGGFVIFEQYHGVGRGKAVIYVSDKGVIAVKKSVADIFGRMPKLAVRTVSSTWWHQGYWVDEGRGTVVVAAKGDARREVSFTDGTVSEPGVKELDLWLRRGASRNRSLALEIASRSKDIDRQLLSGTALALARDEKESFAIRTRAAIVAVRAGAVPGKAFQGLFALSRGANVPDPGRGYAIAHLPEILGDDALPILRSLMEDRARRSSWRHAQEAFVRSGERAVPTLCDMLLDKKGLRDSRGGAANALREIRSKAGLESLFVAAAVADEHVANAAINAAIAIRPADLRTRLIALLEKGCTQDDRIALFFREEPHGAALPALRRARGRFQADSTEREWLDEAIAACERVGRC